MIRVMLPKDRRTPGEIVVVDGDGVVLLGPFPCLGKGDNAGAIEHANRTRDPVRPFGDHPTGVYRITSIQRNKPPAHSYGSAFFHIEPTEGQALEAKLAGRVGLAIHGGDPGADGVLRPTNGCLRVRNDVAVTMANVVQVNDVYVCQEGE
jgi:L,D-transpeptidase catalytic domain